MHLLLTSRCNLRCKYCYLRAHQRSDSPWEGLQQVLNSVIGRNQGDLAFTFTGGEPLLALQTLKRCVTHVESPSQGVRRVRWRLVTNGMLLDEEAVGFLKAHHFFVTLSFDGAPAAHALRGRGTFRVLDALLNRLRAEHRRFFEESLTIRMTLSPVAVPYLAESIKYLVGKNVRSVTIAPALGRFAWRAPQIEQLRAQFGRVTALVRHHRETSGRVPLTMFEIDGLDMRLGPREWNCGAARGAGIAIDVDGQAYACALAAKSHQQFTVPALLPAVEALALGRPDAAEFPQRVAALQETARASGAFDHPELRYSSYRKCADCHYLPRCYACPLAAAHDPTCTDVRRVPDFLCAFNQVTLEARDRFWAGDPR